MGSEPILCDTCGGPSQGGVRRYIGANGGNRIGCDDDAACASRFSTLSYAERRAVRKFQETGEYLRIAGESP